MPHVVIAGPASVERFAEAFSPFGEREGGSVLKAVDVYVSQNRRNALVESLVVEGGRARSFFVHVGQHEGSVTVRLSPLTDPEKTDGVKRLMALVARQVKGQDPACAYGKTNLQPFLIP